MDVNDPVNQAQQINLYQNPGQSISGLYKGLANQCSPGQPFPEAQLVEAWDIPLVLHPEFVPNGDVSKIDKEYGTILAAESAQVILLQLQMAQDKAKACGEITALISSVSSNLNTIKSRHGANYLNLLKRSPNRYPTSVGVEIMSDGSPNQDSGIEVSYGANLARLTQLQLQSMNLPASLKQLLTQGIGVKLSQPEYWPAYNNIAAGIRYTTGMAITLAYWATV
ncbi:TPA: DUF3218 family protein [Pseudomonas aeruginosa]